MNVRCSIRGGREIRFESFSINFQKRCIFPCNFDFYIMKIFFDYTWNSESHCKNNLNEKKCSDYSLHQKKCRRNGPLNISKILKKDISPLGVSFLKCERGILNHTIK